MMPATRVICILSLIFLCGTTSNCFASNTPNSADCKEEEFQQCQTCVQRNVNDSDVYLNSFEQQVCHCDPFCEVYGDCCHPSLLEEHLPVLNQSYACLSKELFACTNVVIDQSEFCNPPNYIWMVSHCPENWASSSGGTGQQRVNDECVNGSPSQPPVTEVSTGVVYRNPFCAVCNGVAQENISNWSVSFKCSNTLEQILAEIKGDTGVHQEQPIDVFNKYCSPKEFVQPNAIVSVPRRCFPFRPTECLDILELANVTGLEWDNVKYLDIISRCTQSKYQNLVVENYDETPYRNEYCALCNGINMTTVECYQPASDHLCVAGISSTILLNLLNNGRILVHTEQLSSTVEVNCNQTQVYDPVRKECQQKFDINQLLAPANDTIVVCNGSFVLLNETDTFTPIEPGIVQYGDEIYTVVYNTTDNHYVICVDFPDRNDTFYYYYYPIGFTVITYVGCSLSVVACFLIIVTYTCFAEIRSLPGKILMILSAVVLLNDLVALVNGSITDAFPNATDLCVATAIFIHLLSLLQFFWMNVLSFEITRTLYHGMRMKLMDTVSKKRRLLIYYILLGNGIPFSIVLIAIVVNFSTRTFVSYGVGEDMEIGSCQINDGFSVFLFFILPVVISILFNIFLFVMSAAMLCRANCSQRKLSKKNNISYFRVSFAVFSVSGSTWLFGFLALVSENEWAWYPFVIFNSTQGVMIFFAFICTRKVLKLYVALLTCKRETKSRSYNRSTFKSQISFQSSSSFINKSPHQNESNV